MELNGACSNPRVKVQILELLRLKTKLLQRQGSGYVPATEKRVLPRTPVPVLKTITQVLELANYRAMRVADLHVACEAMLGKKMSYRSLKATLSQHSRGPAARFTRKGYGRYRLRAGRSY